MTAIHRQLLRPLWLLLACLALALSTAPRGEVMARDTCAWSALASANAEVTPRVSVAARAGGSASPAALTVGDASRPAAVAPSVLAQPDGRYLYLELVTLLS